MARGSRSRRAMRRALTRHSDPVKEDIMSKGIRYKISSSFSSITMYTNKDQTGEAYYYALNHFRDLYFVDILDRFQNMALMEIRSHCVRSTFRTLWAEVKYLTLDIDHDQVFDGRFNSRN